MNQTKEAIETGLTLFQEILMQIPGIGKEFQMSQGDFNSTLPKDDEEAALARRRHFEWFLMERESKQLDGVPVATCMDAWNECAQGAVADLGEALLRSFAGVFEVSSSGTDQGMWLSDLFGLGEYPVESGDCEVEIEAGDLIVGRIFPIGDGIYSMSQAASVFREKKLIKAVRRDLASLRESRRGVMRIGQNEIERLFFEISVSTEGKNSDGINLGHERVLAKRGLREAGLDEDSVKDVMIEITKASASSDSGSVTRILNALAFENDVDLEQAQRVLNSLWTAETHPQATSSTNATKTPVASGAERAEDVRAALAKFDQQKAAGGDVEDLYEQLSQELGITDPESDAPEIVLPDFPGVIAAVIEEFLWDIERVQGAPVASSLERIRLLASFGSDIGVFEDLGKAQVLDFAGRWLLDEAKLRDAEDARASIHALKEFCGWAQEQHSHPLLDDCQGFLDPLAKSIPRLALLRQSCVERADVHSPFDVKSVAGKVLVVLDEEAREIEVAISSKLADMLRAGDLLHAFINKDQIQIAACYPGELRQLLEFKQD